MKFKNFDKRKILFFLSNCNLTLSSFELRTKLDFSLNLIANYNSEEYFKCNTDIEIEAMRELEKTTDLNYKPLIVDFINYPLNLGLTYLSTETTFTFSETLNNK